MWLKFQNALNIFRRKKKRKRKTNKQKNKHRTLRKALGLLGITIARDLSKAFLAAKNVVE